MRVLALELFAAGSLSTTVHPAHYHRFCHHAAAPVAVGIDLYDALVNAAGANLTVPTFHPFARTV